MVSKTEDNKKKRRRIFLALGGIVAVCWLLTIFWGTKQVHQDFLQQERAAIPRHFTVFEDRQSLDKSVNWVLITEPWAPLPFIVSIEERVVRSEYDYYAPKRLYYFWCPGYRSELPIYGRYLPETYEM